MTPDPLEGLRVRLLKAGFSPRHVHRYVGELRDHLTDLIDREQAAGLSFADAQARASLILGGEDDLFKAMLERGAPRSPVARVPWIFFCMLPLAALFVAFLLSARGSLALLAPYQEFASADIPRAVRAVSAAVSLFSNYLIGPAFAAACIVMALRQRLASTWVWVGLTLTAVAAAPLGIQIEFLSPTGIRGAAAFLVHHGGRIDAEATLTRIALRGLVFFGLSAVVYRLLQMYLRRRDAGGDISRMDHA